MEPGSQTVHTDDGPIDIAIDGAGNALCEAGPDAADRLELAAHANQVRRRRPRCRPLQLNARIMSGSR